MPKPKGGKRIRRPHLSQVDIPTSKKFALERGEILSTGVWSDFESIVLNEIISHQEKDSTIDIVTTYNDIVYYSMSTFCAIPLLDGTVFRQKNSKQIHSRINFSNKIITSSVTTTTDTPQVPMQPNSATPLEVVTPMQPASATPPKVDTPMQPASAIPMQPTPQVNSVNTGLQDELVYQLYLYPVPHIKVLQKEERK